jgi:hypothetical protein
LRDQTEPQGDSASLPACGSAQLDQLEGDVTHRLSHHICQNQALATDIEAQMGEHADRAQYELVGETTSSQSRYS